MTLHEEITALLHGDISDGDRIAELMHVLAVSPEKRALFVEQIQLSRAFTALGASVAPPRTADQAIWQGLAAVDAEMAGGTAQNVSVLGSSGALTPIAAASAPLWGKVFAVIAGLLLMTFVIGVQYYEWRDAESTRRAASALGTSSAPVTGLRADRDIEAVTLLRDSLAALRSRYDVLANEHGRALTEIEALRNRSAAVRIVYRDRVVTPSTVVADTARTDAPAEPALLQGGAQVPVEIADVRRANATSSGDHPLDAQRSSSHAVAAVGSDLDDELGTGGTGPWQIGVRDNFRLSLPRVYGLAGSRSIIFDKDIFVAYRLGGGDQGMLSSMRLMASGGETQFGQIYHTNLGKIGPDTVVRQSPTLQYARVVLAPELVRARNMSGSIELGAGVAVSRFQAVGPIATFGTNLEYRPIDMISLQAGLSGWMLWGQYRSQAITSTNLNGHLGFAIGF